MPSRRCGLSSAARRVCALRVPQCWPNTTLCQLLNRPDTVSPPPAVLELLGQKQFHVEPLDSRGEPWLLQTEDWMAVLRRFPPQRYPPEANVAHVAWLHRFLDRLATTGFPAPRPLRGLHEAGMAVVDCAI